MVQHSHTTTSLQCTNKAKSALGGCTVAPTDKNANVLACQCPLARKLSFEKTCTKNDQCEITFHRSREAREKRANLIITKHQEVAISRRWTSLAPLPSPCSFSHSHAIPKFKDLSRQAHLFSFPPPTKINSEGRSANAVPFSFLHR